MSKKEDSNEAVNDTEHNADLQAIEAEDISSPDLEENESDNESGAVSYVAKDGDQNETTDEAPEATAINKDEEPDDDEYERIKQDLLKEYANHENDAVEEQSQDTAGNSENLQEDDLENSNVENDFSIETPAPLPAEHDLEIEDITKNLDGDVIDDIKPLSDNAAKVTPDVDQGISKVAVSKGSSVILMVFVVLGLLYVIYKMLQPSDDSSTQKSDINPNMPVVKPIEDVGQTIVVPEIPKFPDVPKEIPSPAPQALPTPPLPPMLDITPVAPPSPAPISGVPPLASPGGSTPSSTSAAPTPGMPNFVDSIDKNQEAKDAESAARRKTKLKAPIMVGGGGKGKPSNANAQGQDLNKLSRNNDQIAATYIGDLQRIIAQGKVIDAVLETAINTDLPGMIRAVVTRDIYSEAGNNVLITRGSRLIGTYSSSITFGQARVQISWERIIRPDGIDIKVASPGIDAIGRAGSEGDIDNHIMRNFATAMMMSVINISLAKIADNQNATSGTTTSTSTTDATTGSTTSSSTSNTMTQEQQAYANAIQQLSKIGTDVIQKTMNMPPTVTVDQGTTLKVFVKKDIVFPGSSANLTRMIE